MSSRKKNQLISDLIKSCDRYNLNEKESIQAINKVLGKDISRRTYYNYKKKLYDKKIYEDLKKSVYDSKEMKCLLLDIEEINRAKSIEIDKIIHQNFPDKKHVFQYEEKQKEQLKNTLNELKSDFRNLEDKFNLPLKNYESIPKDNVIREEYSQCGKKDCKESHGPYYYAYWRDKDTKKLIKKYMGRHDPRK